MRFRVYIATSLDGYVATPDGGVEWLEPFQDEDYGYNSFIQKIGTVIMGRTTFQQVLGFGQWPYKDLRVMVLSSHPLRWGRRRCPPIRQYGLTRPPSFSLTSVRQNPAEMYGF